MLVLENPVSLLYAAVQLELAESNTLKCVADLNLSQRCLERQKLTVTSHGFDNVGHNFFFVFGGRYASWPFARRNSSISSPHNPLM